MDSVYMTVLGLLSRHFITVAAGWLLSNGIIQQSQVQAFSAACLLFGGILLSMWQKWGKIIMDAHTAQRALQQHADKLGLKVAALAALALLSPLAGGPTHAADMPTKAQAAPICTTINCTGFYVGFGFTGSGQNVDVLSGGLNQLFSAGSMIHVPVGYQVWNGKYFFAIEVAGGYDVAGSASKDGRWIATEMVKFGIGLDALFGNVATAPAAPSQTPAPISIPASIAQSLMSPYIMVGGVQRPSSKGWGTGAGAEFVLAQGWNLDLQYIRANYTDKNVVDANGVPELVKSENLWRLQLLRKF